MKRFALILLAILTVSVITGCNNGDDDDDGVKVDLTTVAGAFQALVDSWEEADYEAYEKIFADGFTFYFDQLDIIDGAPESWGRAAELDAASVIFVNADADDIELTLALPDDFTEPDGDTCNLNNLAYQISVTFDDVTYEAEASCYLTLERSGDEWFFTQWIDMYSFLAGDCCTWGGIKYQLGT